MARHTPACQRKFRNLNAGTDSRPVRNPASRTCLSPPHDPNCPIPGITSGKSGGPNEPTHTVWVDTLAITDRHRHGAAERARNPIRVSPRFSKASARIQFWRSARRGRELKRPHFRFYPLEQCQRTCLRTYCGAIARIRSARRTHW